MSTETATLALNGNVFLDDFAKAVQYLHQLMDGLSREVAKQKIDWRIDRLETGSALITMEAPHSGAVVKAYAKVGKLLQRNQPLPYGPTVKNAASRLCGLMNGRITSIRFETSEADAEVFSNPNRSAEQVEIIRTFGAVEGRIQSLSNRGRLRFTIYDLHEDRAISCYLSEGCEDVMRDSWGRMAVVEGMVSRDPNTGKVSTVRDVSISGVRLLETKSKYTWKDAIGCSPALTNSISTEEAVRRSRERGIVSTAPVRKSRTTK